MAKKKNDKKIKKGIKKMACIAIMFAILGLSAPVMAEGEAIKFASMNLSGDIVYLPTHNSFGTGLGTDIASLYGVVNVRAEYVDPMEEGVNNKAGLGVGLNLAALVKQLGGVWFLGGVNASIGVQALADFEGDAHLQPALYFNVVQIIK